MSPTLDHSITVYKEKIDRTEVAKYYLAAEFPNILHTNSDELQNVIHQSLDNLSEKELWRLLEALSHTYRLNGVFSLITNEGYDWYDVELPIDAITLSGTTPAVNEIVYSEEIQRSPVKFAQYLKHYFTEHDASNDLIGLNSFRPRGPIDDHPRLLTMERKGKTVILDGSHRLMALAQMGHASFRAYAAVKNDEPPRSMLGDDVFLMLRRLYERWPEQAQHEAIIRTTEMAVAMSTDGPAAINEYWVVHPRRQTTKEIGRQILAAIPSLPPEIENTDD